MHVDVFGPHSEDIRHHLRAGGADAAADVRNAALALDAAVVVDEHFRARRRAVEVVPEALRESGAALHRAAALAGPRLLPAEVLRADAPLGPARRMRVVPVA